MIAADEVEQFPYRFLHDNDLGAELFGGGAFFGAGGIGLGHMIHLTDRTIDLLDPLGLFPRSGRDFGHQLIHPTRFGNNLR